MNQTKKTVWLAILFALGASATTARAADESSTDNTAEIDLKPASDAKAQPVDLPANLGDFCFFAHLPPASQKYKVIKKVKIGKGSYGNVTDILPKLADYARLHGADAIVEYDGAQHFGFWPWRLVRPIVHGVAVQWTEPKTVDCEAVGGTKLSTILATNKPPAN